ncbi:MAG: hypothetical protein JWM47_3835 [Acidimicrobiales bacterium]|nr:hypothetical protein [Acidimicrobiales bacterium]
MPLFPARFARLLAAGAVAFGASIAVPAAPASAGAPCVKWQSCSGDGTWPGAKRLAASCRADGGVPYKGPNWPDQLDVECHGGPKPGPPIPV